MKIAQKISDKFWRIMLGKSSRLFPHLFHPWEAGGIVGDSDAEAYVKTYSAASWVYICVNKIAQTCASVPLKFYRKLKGENEEIETGELVELFSKVNPFISFGDLIGATVAYQLLNGNAYWSIEQNGNKEIFPLRPDRIKIVPDSKEYIKGYLYSINNTKIAFDTDEILHFKFFNPTNDYYGLSPLAVARNVLTQEFYAITSNKNLFKNAVRPGGVLEVPSELSDSEHKRLKADWEKAHKEVNNWHKLVILEGGAQWKNTIMTPKDMEFIQLRKMNREEICAIFGVPPAMVGIFEYANYANSEVQRKMFWADTIIPILKKLQGTLNERFIEKLESNTFCLFDFSNVEALKKNEKEKMEVATGLVGRNIFSVNEAREYFYQLSPVDWGDQPQPQTPQFGLSLSMPSKPAIEPTQIKMIQDSRKAINYTDEEYTFWKRFDNRLSDHQNRFKQKIIEFFEEQKNRVLENFHAFESKKLLIKFSEEEIDMIFDSLQEEGLLENLSRTEFHKIIKEIGEQTLIEIGVDFAFNPITPSIETWMRSKIQMMVKSVIETSRSQIADIIIRGFDEGNTVQEISGQIADHLEQVKDYRSDRIARTEVIGANNKATWEAYKQSGIVKKKQWIATLDERVRDTHEKIHHQIRGIDEYFNVGDDLLMFPGDIGSPGEVINCRCTIIAVFEE